MNQRQTYLLTIDAPSSPATPNTKAFFKCKTPYPVTAIPQPDSNPQRPLSQHILDILDQWHRKHGTKYPPCNYRASRHAAMPWKVFDRTGTEMQLCTYTVITRRRYNILVLSGPNHPDRIVACVGQRFRFGTFLVAWQGVEKGYESRSCAIRCFASEPGADVVYRPRVWGIEPVDATPKRWVLAEEGSGRRQSGGGAVSRPPASSASTSPSPSSSSSDSDGEGEEEEEEQDEGSSSSEEEEQEEEPEKEKEKEPEPVKTTPSTKKRKRNSDHHTQTPASSPPPSPRKDPEVIFKLVSDQTDATRSFPLEECKAGKYLFANARKFFRLLDESAEVTVLSCRIPGSHERRWLYEGREGEFRLLLDDVKGSKASTKTKTMMVEVKCVA